LIVARFKKMTPQQRTLYAVLRRMRECVLVPADARPARELKRRGLIRYARRDGVRIIVLRTTHAERVEKRRLHRWNKGDFWPEKKTHRTLEPSRLAGPSRRGHAARKKFTT
jgi:hypothetical protein